MFCKSKFVAIVLVLLKVSLVSVPCFFPFFLLSQCLHCFPLSRSKAMVRTNGDALFCCTKSTWSPFVRRKEK